MLDVHAPHRTVHTWKDFIIHIATITIGLLIAIGLEKTVELFHHRHQSPVGLDLLKQESDKNRITLKANMRTGEIYEVQQLINEIATSVYA